MKKMNLILNANTNTITDIWNIKFEKLNNWKIKKIIIKGPNKYDLLTRLEYANIKKKKIILL